MLVNPTGGELESNCSERGASGWSRVRRRNPLFAGATLRLRVQQTRASGTRRSTWWDEKSGGDARGSIW